MSRKKDREKAAKRTANQPAWERFSADVQGLSSIQAAKTLLANPPARDAYAQQLHTNLQHFIDSGFKRPPGAEPKEGRLYRAFFSEYRLRAAARAACTRGCRPLSMAWRHLIMSESRRRGVASWCHTATCMCPGRERNLPAIRTGPPTLRR